MKVLNLYSGIGGNRKLWQNVDVTAVEFNEEIAAIYREYFPDDKMIIEDAHEYLLKHYKEFDFIWSSTPCPSHSRARFWGSKGGQVDPVYPDWHLWQEILFLKHFSEGKWIVENVVPYYEPFIKPDIQIDKHCFWSNFNIKNIELDYPSKREEKISVLKNKHGFDLCEKTGINKTQVMRNTVNPELGLYILEQAQGIIRQDKIKQIDLFT
jgi:DNA (cytosine-5)-methyltransferase 1